MELQGAVPVPDEAGPAIATTEAMARMLNVSAMYLGMLAKDGTLPKPVSRGRWDLEATVRAYVAFLAAKAKKGEAERAEEFALTAARRRRTEYLAETAALELAEKVGDVGSLTVMGTEVSYMLDGLKGRLTPIGAIVAPQLELAATTAERQAIVDAAIFEALDDLSGSPFRFLGPGAGARGAGAGRPGGSDGGHAEGAAPDDPEPMG